MKKIFAVVIIILILVSFMQGCKSNVDPAAPTEPEPTGTTTPIAMNASYTLDDFEDGDLINNDGLLSSFFPEKNWFDVLYYCENGGVGASVDSYGKSGSDSSSFALGATLTASGNADCSSTRFIIDTIFQPRDFTVSAANFKFDIAGVDADGVTIAVYFTGKEYGTVNQRAQAYSGDIVVSSSWETKTICMGSCGLTLSELTEYNMDDVLSYLRDIMFYVKADLEIDTQRNIEIYIDNVRFEIF